MPTIDIAQHGCDGTHFDRIAYASAEVMDDVGIVAGTEHVGVPGKVLEQDAIIVRAAIKHLAPEAGVNGPASGTAIDPVIFEHAGNEVAPR